MISILLQLARKHSVAVCASLAVGPGLATAVGLVIGGSVAVVAQNYRTELKSVFVLPRAVNSAGVAVGRQLLFPAAAAVTDPYGLSYQQLPIPAAYNSSSTTGINDHGWIVGYVNLILSLATEAVLWLPDGLGGYSTQFLGKLPGDAASAAMHINNAGMIVGWSRTTGGLYRSVRFDGIGGVFDLTPFGAPPRPGGLNDDGILLGPTQTFDVAALTATPLPPLPPTWSNFDPAAISNAGGIAGRVLAAGGERAVRWLPSSGWQIVGPPPLNNLSDTFDINSAGAVTGVSGEPFVDLPGVGLFTLQSLISAPGWVVSDSFPCLVTESGVIVMTGANSGAGIGGIVYLVPDGCQMDLGSQGPGTLAATCCGDGLDVGQVSTYVATGAPPLASGVALVSVAGSPDFSGFGGTLLSFGGYFLALPISSDDLGVARLPIGGAPWPGIELVMQGAFLNPALPAGLTFANAIRVRFGP